MSKEQPKIENDPVPKKSGEIIEEVYLSSDSSGHDSIIHEDGKWLYESANWRGHDELKTQRTEIKKENMERVTESLDKQISKRKVRISELEKEVEDIIRFKEAMQADILRAETKE